MHQFVQHMFVFHPQGRSAYPGIGLVEYLTLVSPLLGRSGYCLVHTSSLTACAPYGAAFILLFIV